MFVKSSLSFNESEIRNFSERYVNSVVLDVDSATSYAVGTIHPHEV